MSNDERTVEELLELNRQLLASIESADWETYARLCDPSLTAREPEAVGHLIEGMDFHRHYFDNHHQGTPRNTTISSPHVRLLGDVAVVTYVRLTQSIADPGIHTTGASEETRIWQKQNGAWQHVHFHRSVIG